MAARLANSGDVTTYSDFGVVLNDIIDDANENTTSRHSFHNVPSDFPAFRSGGTVWLKNPAQGNRYSWRITGNGTEWGDSTIDNPVHFKVLDQCFFRKDERNTNTYLFEISDCPNVHISGYHPDYMGMRDPSFSSYPEDFFGLRFDKDGFTGEGTNMLAVKGDLNSVVIEDVFVSDGFAKIRVQPDPTSIIEKLEVHRCWGQFGSGEFLYLGLTNGGQTALVKNYHISDSVAFMTGAEGFQVQDLMMGTHSNIIENSVLVYNASDWKAPFLAAQGSGSQFRYNEGGIIIRNCIIYGWGANGINLQYNIYGDPETNNGRIIFDNVLLTDGHDKCVLLNTNNTDITHVFQRCDFGHIDADYSSMGGTQSPMLVNIFHRVNNIFRNNRFDDARTFYEGEDPGNEDLTQDINNEGVSNIPRPDFVNVGFTEEAYKFLNWNYETSDGTPSPGTPISYSAGDIVRFKIMEEVFTVDIATNEIIKTAHGYSNNDFFKFTNVGSGTSPSPMATADLYYVVNATTDRFQIAATEGGSAINITTTGTGVHKFWMIRNSAYGRFYKALTNHSSTEATRPDRDTTNWVVLTWDESGVRSDQIGWSSGDTQSYLAPRNVLLEAGSEHEALGRRRGLSFGPTNYTEYQWQVSTDSGVTWEDIPYPGARLSYFNYSEIGYDITGKMFRRNIVGRRPGSGATITDTSPSASF